MVWGQLAICNKGFATTCLQNEFCLGQKSMSKTTELEKMRGEFSLILK